MDLHVLLFECRGIPVDVANLLDFFPELVKVYDVRIEPVPAGMRLQIRIFLKDGLSSQVRQFLHEGFVS